MKRIIWFLVLVLLTLSVNSQSIFRRGVIIGNQKTGSNVATVDSVTTSGTDATFYSGGSILNATNNDTVSLSDRAVMKPDSNTYDGYIKRAYLESRLGSGAGYSKYKMQFVVGADGFPADGDSSVTHTDWSGKEIDMFRDGLSQRYNSTATNTVHGFRLNNSTGELIVNPLFATGEIIKIDAYDPVNVEWLTLSGTESTLLTDLVAYYQLNETSGTSANSVLGTLLGTNVNVTVNTAGKFGTAFQYAGTGYTNMGTASGLRLQTLTISFWVNTSMSGSYAGLATNYVWGNSRYNGYATTLNSDGTVDYDLQFTDATSLKLTSTSTINNGAWHNVIITWDGTTAYLYIDNVQEDTDGGVAKTIIYHANCAFHIGDRNETDLPFTGYIDGLGVWNKVVTAGERAELQLSTYPF